MSSAPFPEMGSPSEMGVMGGHSLKSRMTDRGCHVPTWYDPKTSHSHPERIVVKHPGGMALLAECDGEPFTVVEVPIERRWVIGEDGVLIDEHTYHMLSQRYVDEFYELKRMEPGSQDVKFDGNQHAEPVPTLSDFVMQQVMKTDTRRLEPMHYQPHATAGAKPERLYAGADDEDGRPRMEVLAETYQAGGRLTRNEIREVEAHLGVSTVEVPDAIATQLEKLTADFAAKRIKQGEFHEAIGKLTGHQIGKTPEQKEADRERMKAVRAARGQAVE